MPPVARRHQRQTASWSLRRCWVRLLVERRSRVLLYLTLMTIIVCQWYINFSQPALTRNTQRLLSDYKGVIKRIRGLEYQLKMLTFKFDFREHINALALRKYEHVTATRPTFQTSDTHWVRLSEQEFLHLWPVVVDVQCKSPDKFKFFLGSFQEGLENSKSSVVCVFALNCCQATTEWRARVVAMVSEFDGCPMTFVWNVPNCVQGKNFNFRRRHRKIEEVQKPKLRWWALVNNVFQSAIKEGVLFNGILRDFKQDIMFIDSGVLLSPDFIQVASLARKVKARLPGITQFSLGTWAGQNLINAHPDSFAVRLSRDYHGIVYGMNESNWQTLSSLQEYFLEDLNPVWTESVADAVSSDGIRTIVPTLSRYWLMSPAQSNLARASFPPWLLSPRLLSRNATKVNIGVRDSLGFLCRKVDTLNDVTTANAICYCSFWAWQKTQLNLFPRCLPQGNDDCLDSY